MSDKQKTHSHSIFSTVFDTMKEMNSQTIEFNQQMQRTVQDWMVLQNDTQQTAQKLMQETGAQMMQQVQGSIQQGVELSKMVVEAQQQIMQETMRMMGSKQ